MKLERSVRFEELVFRQDSAAELLGAGCTGEPWARVECSAGVAMGGTVMFKRDGDPSELVRLSRAERTLRMALPAAVRIVVDGQELKRWSIAEQKIVMLPGDAITLTIHL